jgi:hypothetical protein
VRAAVERAPPAGAGAGSEPSNLARLVGFMVPPDAAGAAAAPAPATDLAVAGVSVRELLDETWDALQAPQLLSPPLAECLDAAFLVLSADVGSKVFVGTRKLSVPPAAALAAAAGAASVAVAVAAEPEGAMPLVEAVVGLRKLAESMTAVSSAAESEGASAEGAPSGDDYVRAVGGVDSLKKFCVVCFNQMGDGEGAGALMDFGGESGGMDLQLLNSLLAGAAPPAGGAAGPDFMAMLMQTEQKGKQAGAGGAGAFPS